VEWVGFVAAALAGVRVRRGHAVPEHLNGDRTRIRDHRLVVITGSS
jgi:hypothetical protein